MEWDLLGYGGLFLFELKHSMHFFDIFVLIWSGIIFLFVSYALTHDDFVFVRKNISLEQIFNTLFVIIGVGFLSGRILYVLSHFTKGYLNPLVFFLFLYFPGISVVGGVVGGGIAAFIFSRKKRFSTFRLLDIVSLAFLASYSTSLLITSVSFLLQKKGIYVLHVLAVFLLFSTLWLLIKGYIHSKLKDGSVSSFVVLSFSFCGFIIGLVENIKVPLRFIIGEGVLYVFLFLLSLGYIFKQEKLMIYIHVILQKTKEIFFTTKNNFFHK